MMKRYLLYILLLLSAAIYAQDKKEKVKVSMRDSLDGAFDMSDYLIYAHGFIAVPTIITEPALGSFGGALVPVFINKKKPYVNPKTGRITPVRPEITGAMGMYTANDSWMTMAFRSGTFAKQGITYRAMAGYGSLNISLYETLPGFGEREFKFHFNTIPVYLQALKILNNPKWSVGGKYFFLKTELSLPGENLPQFIRNKEINSITSQLGGIIQYDDRDNIFTPDKGVRLQGSFFWSDNIIGSDFESWRINYSAIGYKPITKKLIGGIRIEGTNVFGSPAFFLKPSVDLRGTAKGRYQAENTLVTEGELRWDAYKRWSVMLFGGLGSAFDNYNQMFDKPLAYGYGTGFRYLIARKFKLRMGIDVAKGNEQWAYYIVFGSNWLR
ncbi:BamA/TamA family outer membrane protein [Flavobacterium sp. ST-75]|uniref:BamA/TamA family outer membrane protein n=1 Tax=Flavobacterium rhizophilum TaxID=3163296 RepID=A0ABW8Y9X5_9FLAO